MPVTCVSHAGLPEGGRGAGCSHLPSDGAPSCGEEVHMSVGGGANGAQTAVKGWHCA